MSLLPLTTPLIRLRSKMNREKRNYMLGVLHGVFYFAATAFVDYTTILPTFIRHLVSSSAVIGFVSAIARGGTMVFRLISAAYLEGKKKKPILVVSLWVRFISWLLITVSAYLFLPEHPLIELALFVLFISLFSFAGGVAVIPFYDIITHNIPSNKLGRFWATRQFIGGLLAVVSGYIVKIVMKHNSYPENYILLFLIATFVYSLAFLSLGSMDEGELKQKPNASFGEFIRSALEILKKHKDFSSMVLSEFLSHSLFMCLPFIAIYATYTLSLNRSDLGYFISAQMAGSILSNLLWGYFADKRSAKLVIVVSNVIALSIPIFLLFVASQIMFVVIFFLIGAYMHGSFIGYTNYMLKVAPEEKRPTYVSIRGTFNALSYFLPTLGGFLIDSFSYIALFVFTAVFSFAGFLYGLSLKNN